MNISASPVLSIRCEAFQADIVLEEKKADQYLLARVSTSNSVSVHFAYARTVFGFDVFLDATM